MKSSIVFSAIVTFGILSAATASAGPCKSLSKITAGVQAACNDKELQVVDIVHYFQGEGADTYILKVKKGTEEKNISVWIQAGECDSATINPDPSHCP